MSEIEEPVAKKLYIEKRVVEEARNIMSNTINNAVIEIDTGEVDQAAIDAFFSKENEPKQDQSLF